jgi:signal transduction histidine kinase
VSSIPAARLALLVFASVAVVELLIVQPLAWLGPALIRQPGAVFEPFVDVVRALAWLTAVVVAGVGFTIGRTALDRGPEQEDRRQRWLWSVLDSFSEGIVAFDAKGRVAFANRAALAHLQRRALPDGTPMAAFADVPRLRSSVATALLDRVPVTVELLAAGPPPRFLMALACPVDDGAVLLMVDVTEMRAAVQAREAFLSDAAHELRTPVAGVLASAEALSLGGIDDPVRGGQLVEGIVRQATRLRRLVDDLMALVRLESGAAALDVEPHDLRSLVDGVMGGLPEGAERVRLVGGVRLEVLVDALGFERVVRNLVENALRYTEGPVDLAWGREPEGVWLAVCDAGPGVPDADKDKIFERFYRIDASRSRAVGGTGLGLAIVRELVEQFGGRVRCEDNHPVGARFVVTLPERDRSWSDQGAISDAQAEAQTGGR